MSKASFGDKMDVDCDFVDDYYPCKSFWIKNLDLRGKHSNHFWRCIMNAFLTREKFSETNVRVEFHSFEFNFLEWENDQLQNELMVIIYRSVETNLLTLYNFLTSSGTSLLGKRYIDNIDCRYQSRTLSQVVIWDSWFFQWITIQTRWQMRREIGPRVENFSINWISNRFV